MSIRTLSSLGFLIGRNLLTKSKVWYEIDVSNKTKNIVTEFLVHHLSNSIQFKTR